MAQQFPDAMPDPADQHRGQRLKHSRKVLLIALMLGLLGILVWQVHQQFQQMREQLRRQTLDNAAQQAAQLQNNLHLQARSALLYLYRRDNIPLERLRRDLQELMPGLLDLSRLDARGRSLNNDNAERRPLTLPVPGTYEEYRYALHPRQSQVILLVMPIGSGPQNGYWLLRFDSRLLGSWLPIPPEQGAWSLEDASGTHRLASVGNSERALASEPIGSFNLQHSDLVLRAYFDQIGALRLLLPELAGKLALLAACLLLAILAVVEMLGELRRLREGQAQSRRSLRLAASALAAIDEQVLLTDETGLISYLSPKAEALLGVDSGVAEGRGLQALLPNLPANLLDDDFQSTLVSMPLLGPDALFQLSRSHVDDQANAGWVWVLRDVTEEQRSLRGLEYARRRYQDIFESAGVALCLLDLSELPAFFREQAIEDAEGLQQWLQTNPEQHPRLLARIRLREANRLAKALVDDQGLSQNWRSLLEHIPIHVGGMRFRLLAALLQPLRRVEVEGTLHGGEQPRHLRLVLNLPKRSEDLHAVVLSLEDVTERKRVQLAIAERERFWSKVVGNVPEVLYVIEPLSRRTVFTNHNLARALGYDEASIERLGAQSWERLVHPDDAEYMERSQRSRLSIGDGITLESQLRLRHADGSWRWIEYREQAFARDAEGRVTQTLGLAKDITAQARAHESLKDSEHRYRRLTETLSDLLFTTDERLSPSYISPSVSRLLGYPPEFLLEQGLGELAINPAQLAPVRALFGRLRNAQGDPRRLAALAAEQDMRPFAIDCRHRDGQRVTLQIRMLLLWDNHGRFEGLLGVAEDITLQRRAERELRMAATVFEHSTAAILVTDPAGYIAQVNKTFTRISGFSSEEVVDQLPTLLTARDQNGKDLQYVVRQISQYGSWEGELWLQRRSGERYPAWVGITAVHDEEGDLSSYVCFFNDMSERKASEQRIHRLAYYDALTHLPNRSLFQDRLHSALLAAQRRGEWVALMFLDLDRFKPINDSLGHAAGDRMLQEVAARLTRCVSDDDTVARMGGDEFTLLLQSQAQRDAALHRAVHVAEQILTSLSAPFILEGREFFVSASVGIALSPQDGEEASGLMKNADTAMYHAKERGKDNFQFYQAEMNASALERLELESDLRHALEEQQFELAYQPQFSCDGKRLTGVEALLRWRHPTRGLVSPGQFIPALEEIGLVVPVGDWVLAEACRQMGAWHAEGARIPKVSVNLSARQFADGQLGARIARILGASGLPSAALELELTESILMHDVEQAMQTLAGLKELGVSIAVDDFGTGYSSLNYLKRFPIDVLKIDRSFVDGLPDGERDAQIASAIVAMAHSLDLRVIAEGVERQAQLDFLREHACDEVQGFLFGRPMSARQIAAHFSANTLFFFG